MKRYRSYFKENKNLTLFGDLRLNDKIKNLSFYPYNNSLYYHATHKDNYKNIIRSGIKGDEIWVSKGKPIDDYNTGVLFALNLKDIELKPDLRWKTSDQVYITTEFISPKRIVRIFDYFDELDMREDILALKVHKKSKQDIINIIEEYEI